MTEIDLFKGERTVWLRQNAPSQSGFSIVTNPRLHFQSAPKSPMQLEPTRVSSFAPFQQQDSILRNTTDIDMAITPTSEELESPLMRETNHPFVYLMSLFPLLNTRISLQILLQMILRLRQALGGLESINRGQTSD